MIAAVSVFLAFFCFAVPRSLVCLQSLLLSLPPVLVRIEVPNAIALEPFKVASKLGRFVLRDEGAPGASLLSNATFQFFSPAGWIRNN